MDAILNWIEDRLTVLYRWLGIYEKPKEEPELRVMDDEPVKVTPPTFNARPYSINWQLMNWMVHSPTRGLTGDPLLGITRTTFGQMPQEGALDQLDQQAWMRARAEEDRVRREYETVR